MFALDEAVVPAACREHRHAHRQAQDEALELRLGREPRRPQVLLRAARLQETAGGTKTVVRILAVSPITLFEDGLP
jgi:hypothetical protein